MEVIHNPRQATPVIIGYEFQFYAGIYLMLKFFDEFNALKIEGQKEDIEIKKNSGACLYIQAKASEMPFSISNGDASVKFKKAMESFADIPEVKDNDELIYITNIYHNPFGVDDDELFEKEYYYKYSDLKPNMKSKISSYASLRGIDPLKIRVAGMRFHGDNDTRIAVVKEWLKEIITSIDPQLSSFSVGLLEMWHSAFSLNAMSRRRIMTKEEIATDLARFMVDSVDIGQNLRDLGIGLNESISAIDSYAELIEKKSFVFEDYASVVQLWDSFCQNNPDKNIADFFAVNTEGLVKILELDNDDEDSDIMKTCAVIISYKIIFRRKRLEKIYKKLRGNPC